MNPWEKIELSDYENHMRWSTVNQLQSLKHIMKSQIYCYNVSKIAILGVAGGNGLEHISPENFEIIYGIDINSEYLNECRKRFIHLGDSLKLLRADLSDLHFDLPEVDMVIANLFVEYIGIDIFTKQLSKKRPLYVSVVVQKDADEGFISDSPYEKVFTGLEEVHHDIEKTVLISEMKNVNYKMVFEEETFLPNGKRLIRCDFNLHDIT